MNWRHKILHNPHQHRPSRRNLVKLWALLSLLTVLSLKTVELLAVRELGLRDAGVFAGQWWLWRGFELVAVGTIPLAFMSPYLSLKPTLLVAVTWVGYVLCGFLSSLFILAILTSLLALLLGLLLPLSADQLTLLLAVGALLTAGLFSGLGWIHARGHPVLETRELQVSAQRDDAEPLRLVQLSDLHIGNTVGKRFVRRLVAQVNALSPDIIVITGDVADGSAARLKPVAQLLGYLEARLGRFVVLGNHDYYSGADAWKALLADCGFTVLMNAHRRVSANGIELAIAGITDQDSARYHPTDRPDPAQAVAGIPPGMPIIMLAHQPRSALDMPHERISLQLSGHTHAGQFWPFKYFVKLQQPVTAGYSERLGHPLYVSRGTGYWGPPKRIFARPEITLFMIRPCN